MFNRSTWVSTRVAASVPTSDPLKKYQSTAGSGRPKCKRPCPRQGMFPNQTFANRNKSLRHCQDHCQCQKQEPSQFLFLLDTAFRLSASSQQQPCKVQKTHKWRKNSKLGETCIHPRLSLLCQTRFKLTSWKTASSPGRTNSQCLSPSMRLEIGTTVSNESLSSRHEVLSSPLTQALLNIFLFPFLAQQGLLRSISIQTSHLKPQFGASQSFSPNTLLYEMEKHFSCSAQVLSLPRVFSLDGHVAVGGGGTGCGGGVGSDDRGSGGNGGRGERGETGVGGGVGGDPGQPGVGNTHVQESPTLSMHVSKSKDCVLKQVATPFSGTFSPITGA